MSTQDPPIVAWAVVYPVGMRAYGGRSHALFLDNQTAVIRASGARGAVVRTLVEESMVQTAVEAERAALLRKFDAYVPADQASSMRYRIAELEAQVAELQRALSDTEGGAHD